MTNLTYIHMYMYIDIYEKRALWIGKRRNLFAFEANILYYTMFLFGFWGWGMRRAMGLLVIC